MICTNVTTLNIENLVPIPVIRTGVKVSIVVSDKLAHVNATTLVTDDFVNIKCSNKHNIDVVYPSDIVTSIVNLVFSEKRHMLHFTKLTHPLSPNRTLLEIFTSSLPSHVDTVNVSFASGYNDRLKK